ncbi:MAG: MOSC domain-containing protein [Calditrichaeota bacterium]|nr:MAG: MOSC domain-containing protein [Calditrichota bacterium]
MTHLTTEQLQKNLTKISTLSDSQGELKLIVARLPEEQRLVLNKAKLTAENGVPGDRWNLAEPKNPEAQITIMNYDVAEMIAIENERIPEFGDNLYVEASVGVEEFPVGTKFKIGSATLEITSKAHTGCHKFARRFGHEALKFVNSKETAEYRLRGVYAKVIEDGVVEVGNTLEKI